MIDAEIMFKLMCDTSYEFLNHVRTLDRSSFSMSEREWVAFKSGVELTVKQINETVIDKVKYIETHGLWKY